MKKILKKFLGNAFGPERFIYRSYHTGRAMIANWLHQNPANRMVIIGVTGTNGKTTTCNLLAHILESAGHKVGLATTVNLWTGANKSINETKMTTENPFALQRLLRQMADNGCTYAVIETSSHALIQNRVWGINYDCVVFTNLTPEHLDFHETFEKYRDAKGLLFARLYASPRKANVRKLMVLNLDDETSQYYNQYRADAKYFYSTNVVEKNDTHTELVTSQGLTIDRSGNTFTLQGPTGEATIRLHLPGVFNVRNALAAASAAIGLGIPLDHIKTGLEKVKLVPGRMETIDLGQPFSVIVDYAHTPDGFFQVLSTARAFTTGRLIVVFGATGDRDRSKRPALGKIASEHADIIFLTEEDPGSESPLDIIAEIRPGISPRFTENQNLFTVINRAQAIKQAFRVARAGDTVMLLAMGAQTKMMTAQGLVPYNEREVAKTLLQEIINNP